MSRARRGIWLLAGMLGCLSQVAAQKPKAEPSAVLETKGLLYDAAKLVGLPKPVGWEFDEVVSQPVSNEVVDSVAVLNTQARTDEFGAIGIKIFLINGVSVDMRRQAVNDKVGQCAAGRVHQDLYTLTMDPVPHAVYVPATETSEKVLMVHLPANGRAMTAMFVLSKQAMPKARAALVELAQKIELQVPQWPGRAERYEYVVESGFELAFSPSVGNKERSAMRKIVKSVVRDFTKDHVAPYFRENCPVIIYVDPDSAARGKLLRLQDEVEVGSNVMLRRIVTPVIDAKDRASQAVLGSTMYEYLLSSVYPVTGTRWMFFGEELLYRLEGICGKALPTLPRSDFTHVKAVGKSLPDAVLKTRDHGITWHHRASWIAYFRLGPAKYRKAYAQYLKELRTGVDPIGSRDRLLATCDHAALWADARRFLDKKLKIAKE